MKIKNPKNTASGQILITLLVVMVTTMIISMAAVTWVIDNSLGNSQTQNGLSVLTAAESGIENAMMALLRNPSYTGEVMTVGNTVVTINVSGSNEKTIISQAVEGNFSRKIEVTASYIENILEITSWKESI